MRICNLILKCGALCAAFFFFFFNGFGEVAVSGEVSPRFDWHIPEGATLENDILSISLNEKNTAMAYSDYDLSQFAGKKVKVSILSRGKGVKRSHVSYFGFKVKVEME